MNFQDLDPDSPEYETALEAAQAADDEANGITHPDPNEVDPAAEEGKADPEAPTESAVVEAEKTEEPAADTQPKVAGVLSKDGSRVMPYSALQAERRAAKHERSARERAEAELAATRQQLADLKAGKQPEPAADADELSADELADLTDSIPAVGKLAKQLQATRAELARLQPSKAAAEEPDEPEDDPVQEAIDSVALLSEWQSGDAEKFGRAVEHDKLLKTSPKWAGKSLAERFEEAARRTAVEFDIQVDEEPPPANKSTQSNKPDPKDLLAKAPRQTPNTLSDMRGGATDTDLGRIERLPPTKMLARFETMTDDDIDAQLAKL